MQTDPDRNVVGGDLLPCSDRADDRVLPRRLLLDRAGGSRQPHGVRRDDGGVPRVQPADGERPLDAAARVGIPGPAAGRSLVRLRVAWLEAYRAGVAAPVVLGATHERALEVVPIEALIAHAAPA